MAIVFYYAPHSSALPVASALRELEVPHETVRFDLAAGEQRKPEFLALNPNGKVPTLVVDGTPMFEALAILQWLGDRYGIAKQLWPANDSSQRLVALSWSTWAYVTYAAPLQRLTFAQSPHVAPELHSPAQAEHAKQELQHLLGLLDGQLANNDYLLGKSFSLADLIVSNVVLYSEMCGARTETHARLQAWLERCRSRPSIRAEWG